jgi:hypothetical protein
VVVLPNVPFEGELGKGKQQIAERADAKKQDTTMDHKPQSKEKENGTTKKRRQREEDTINMNEL